MTDVLKMAAREAAALIMERFQAPGRTKTKEKTSHKDIVTAVDTESQEKIRRFVIGELVKKGFKKSEIGFVGEENLNEAGRHVFVIDPIDGTTNFASGLPFFCVSIAYAFQGEILAGVIIDPITGNLFWAERGKGAYLENNGANRRLKIENRELKNCLICEHLNTPEAWKKIRPVYSQVRGVRNLGSMALELAFLAGGMIDAEYVSKCYIWDVAAADVIIKESGGVLTDIYGAEWKPDWDNSGKPLEIMAGHANVVRKIRVKMEI